MTEQKPLSEMTPNPGSNEALKQGCVCAVLDNGHGKSALDLPEGMFWVTGGCPLHDKNGKLKEEGVK